MATQMTFSCFLLLLPFLHNGILIYTVWHLVYYPEHILMFHKYGPLQCYIFFMDLFVCFGSTLDYLHMKTQPHTCCFKNFILAIALFFMGVSNALLL